MTFRPTSPTPHDAARTGGAPAELRQAFDDHIRFSLGKMPEHASPSDRFQAACYVVRDRLVRRWHETKAAREKENPKRAYYLSAEFLLGRALGNNLHNLGIYGEIEKLLGDLGTPLADILESEVDAGLGNGGLGRLAACYMDSMASVGVPAYGYGIRYEFGIFEQLIRDGYQIERPELWLKHGSPWDFPRPECAVKVCFGGRSESYRDEQGELRFRWIAGERVTGLPYDRPVAGPGAESVNTLRLWRARAIEELQLGAFNTGDYEQSVRRKNAAEVISKVLYPNDSSEAGRELRLKQQYFFVRCSIADIFRRHSDQGNSLEQLPEKAAIQLNDTHPSIAVAELMRELVDRHHLPWEQAWEITRSTIAFTNHTVMSEALEKWPVALIGRVLPRHLEIIFEINRRFLRDVSMRFPGEPDRLARMSIIDETQGKRVRMANLAIVGSHAVNGVAALHTEILKADVFRDFEQMYPNRITNVTNGIAPARWLFHCNPALTSAISRRIGDGWKKDLSGLSALAEHADSPELQKEVMAIKRQNKIELARYLERTQGIAIQPDAILDMQIKRIHEYKRQLLNILHVASLYFETRRSPKSARVPRAFLIGGKAASSYETAKTIIKLAGSVGQKINADADCRGKLALHFVANYRVSVAEKLIPACDVSEQISTAGMEASGTSNMKLALNGALTIGTLDGANVEIREQVGAENFFLFGMTAAQVDESKLGGYDPRRIYESNPALKEVIDAIASGYFSPGQPGLFHWLMHDLKNHDPYRILADFAPYVAAQKRVTETYANDPKAWARMVIRNIAGMGPFSSDRSIREYAAKIWGIPPGHPADSSTNNM